MLTVEENIVFPLRLTETIRPIRGGSRRSCGRSRWTAAGRLAPADLSRGEQLRVALARALATRPETLVVDDLACTVDSITWRGSDSHAAADRRRTSDLTVVLATGDAADAALAGHVGDAAA